MKVIESELESAAVKMGIWLFISGALVIGPVGFVLFCLLAYAMHFSNLALGVVCILLLASPLFFVALWAILFGGSWFAERLSQRGRLAAETNPT